MKKFFSRWKAKAQVPIEFMVLFMLFLAVLTIAVVSVTQSTDSVYMSSTWLEAEGLLSLAKSKIDTAFLEGDGFSTSLILPEKILGFNYTLNISSNLLFIEINNEHQTKMLLSGNITGPLRKGENRIQNIGNRIVIS